MKTKSEMPFRVRAWHSYAPCFLLLALLLAVPCTIMAQSSSVLDIRVTYKATKTPLGKALKEIRALTNVRFTYNSDIIRRQPPVTVDVKQVTLEALLKQLLAQTKLQFETDMGGILIYPEENDNSKPGRISFLLTGQVSSEEGGALAGVSIRALESNLGTVTTENGIFSLMAYENEMLRFSVVGMKAVTMKAVNVENGLFMVKLATSPEEMKEVVINGYQRIDARMATAATFKLDAADILQPGAPSVDKMLQGKVPGLMILNTSGSVNSQPVIRMRGTSTFVGNASPLWVIDGMVRPDPVPISSGDLNNAVGGNFSLIGSAVSGLNPYDIESITFLRDAAATAIYGTQAANGVIVIQTKKGKPGPVQINYNTDFSFQGRPSYKRLNLMNSEERVNLSRQLLGDGLVRSTLNNFNPESTYESMLLKLYARDISEAEFKTGVQSLSARNTDWFKLLFRNAFSTSHSLSVNGGTDKAAWYASLSYAKNNGAAKLDGNERYTADVRMNANITKRLKADLHVMASYKKMEGYYDNVSPLKYALQTNRSMSPDEFYPWTMAEIKAGIQTEPIRYNMLHEMAATTNTNSTRSASVNLNLSYNLGGGWRLQHMSNAISDASEAFRAAFESSADASRKRGWNLGEVYPDKLIAISYLPVGGLANFSHLNSLTLNTRNALHFSKSVFKQRDQFDFTMGTELSSRQMIGSASQEPGYFHDRGRTFFAGDRSRRQFSRHTLTDIQDNKLGLYASAAYNVDNRYTLGFTVRSDGSNRFGQYSNAKFLPNYGVSFKWDVTQEKWLAENKIINNLSVRSSYGTQGNVVTEVGPNLVASFIPDNIDSRNLAGGPAVMIKSLPYPNLRWEKTYQWNLGLDVSLLNSRVNVQLDYYGKKSVDLITKRAVPLENGVDEMYVNAGTLLNGGWELVLNVVPIQKKDLNLSFTFINSFNKNRISEQGYQNNYLDYLNGTANVPGRPVSGFYSFAYNGLDPKTGLPQFLNMNTGKVMEPYEFMVYSGKRVPDLFGQVMPNFRYKNFSMTAGLYYSIGGSKRMNPMYARQGTGFGIPGATTNASRDLISRWRKPGDELNTNTPVLRDVAPADFQVLPSMVNYRSTFTMSQYAMYDQSDFRVVNGNFIRCTNIGLRYEISRTLIRKSGIKGLRVGMNIANPFTIASAKLKGQDPEIDGIGTTALPVTRQYAWSIQADF